MTPVTFVVFNRPEATRRSFARIRAHRPERLYIVADGPRSTHPTDAARCEEVRAIVNEVDWPCHVERDYAEHNLGCKTRVSSGLDWVFANEERSIVVEDDCVPYPDFFEFCDELLERYAEDPRISVITGDNFQQGNQRGNASYYFSKYTHIWGWATWRRAWEFYDGDISFWAEWQSSDAWRAAMPDPVERRYWKRVFDRVARDEIDTWDYPWMASVWFNNGLTATPNVNLVTNIGFGPEATHTKGASPGAQTQTSVESIGELTHPSTVQVDVEADRYTFDHHFGGAKLRARRKPIGFAKWLVTGTLRTMKRKLGVSA